MSIHRQDYATVHFRIPSGSTHSFPLLRDPSTPPYPSRIECRRRRSTRVMTPTREPFRAPLAILKTPTHRCCMQQAHLCTQCLWRSTRMYLDARTGALAHCSRRSVSHGRVNLARHFSYYRRLAPPRPNDAIVCTYLHCCAAFTNSPQLLPLVCLPSSSKRASPLCRVSYSHRCLCAQRVLGESDQPGMRR